VPLPQRVAIIGAGLIGRAWAIVFARAGCDVTLYDANPEITRNAHDAVLKEVGAAE